MKLKRYEKNPILSPIDGGNDWEDLATFNPGAWYEDGTVYLLYRASGKEVKYYVHIGLATSTDGYNFTRLEQPMISPSIDGFDAGCMEDPRIVKIEDYYFITYATRAFPPGKYWMAPKDRPYNPPTWPDYMPKFLRENHSATGLLISKDLKSFVRCGRMTAGDVDNRDVILFPERIDGKYVMLHRPVQWTGPEYGVDVPSIWISFSEDVMVWRDDYVLATPQEEWEAHKLGGSTPPLRTNEGWLMLYHAVDKKGIYRVGAMLLDLDDPRKIIRRGKDYILEPQENYELEGFYKGCVFPCGNVIIGDELFVYYGGADKYTGVATCKMADILGWLDEKENRV